MEPQGGDPDRHRADRLISLALFSTTTSLYLLDTLDAFVNQFGILACAWSP